LIHIAAALVYAAAFVLWVRALRTGAKGRSVRVPAGVATLGVAIHLVALVGYRAEFGALPLVGMAPALSTLSLLIGVALVATLVLGEAGRIAILLLPLMILLQTVAIALGIHPTEASMDFRGAWFFLHITLGLAAVVGMAIAGAAGALYLAQFRELKSKRLGKLFQFLPPLATLDRLGRTGVLLSFPALTVAIALGWAWMRTFPGDQARSSTPETVWAVISWAVILGVLLASAGKNRPEHRNAVASLVGFMLIAASYVFVRAFADAGALFL
jgi:HemX protein